jgi:sulfhydrogenase subunit gamma (sulfur reductase)
MNNPYLPVLVEVIKIQTESIDSALFRLKFKETNQQKKFAFRQGQFMLLSLPGAGEAAFTICSSSLSARNYFEVCIRQVGFLTKKFMSLKKGDLLYVRGPYGNGWPSFDKLKNKDLILIGGGCGFVPIRGLVQEIIDIKYSKEQKVQVLYGCASEQTLLFQDEYDDWLANELELFITLEKQKKVYKYGQQKALKGMLTDLFIKKKILTSATAFLVGPPAMFSPVIKILKKMGFTDTDIYFSIERRMHCGVGVCQHCAVNNVYACQDGPVFNLDDLDNNPDLI